MKVIASTYRHRLYKEGYRCIIEYKLNHEIVSFYDMKKILSTQYGVDVDYDRTTNTIWRSEIRRKQGVRRIYLQDASILTFLMLANPELHTK